MVERALSILIIPSPHAPSPPLKLWALVDVLDMVVMVEGRADHSAAVRCSCTVLQRVGRAARAGPVQGVRIVLQTVDGAVRIHPGGRYLRPALPGGRVLTFTPPVVGAPLRVSQHRVVLLGAARVRHAAPPCVVVARGRHQRCVLVTRRLMLSSTMGEQDVILVSLPSSHEKTKITS